METKLLCACMYKVHRSLCGCVHTCIRCIKGGAIHLKSCWRAKMWPQRIHTIMNWWNIMSSQTPTFNELNNEVPVLSNIALSSIFLLEWWPHPRTPAATTNKWLKWNQGFCCYANSNCAHWSSIILAASLIWSKFKAHSELWPLKFQVLPLKKIEMPPVGVLSIKLAWFPRIIVFNFYIM